MRFDATGATVSPPSALGRGSPSTRARLHQRLTLATLTPNRAAAARWLMPSATASRTRTRRSSESAFDMSAGPLPGTQCQLMNDTPGDSLSTYLDRIVLKVALSTIHSSLKEARYPNPKDLICEISLKSFGWSTSNSLLILYPQGRMLIRCRNCYSGGLLLG